MQNKYLFVKYTSWFLVIFFSIKISLVIARTNIPGEVGVANAHIFYYTGRIPFNTPTSTAFLPYVGYLSSSGTPTDYLMDTFIFYDLDKSGANASGHNYDIDEFKTYLNDTFIKARLPILTKLFYYGDKPNGQSASMEIEHGILQRYINISSSGKCTFASYGILPNATGQIANTGMIAFEIFDSTGEEIKGINGEPGLGGNVIWSDYYDIWYVYLHLSDNWRQFFITLDLSPEVSYITIQLKKGEEAGKYKNQVYYDYAQFVFGDSNSLLNDSELESSNFHTLINDGSFEEIPRNSPWETAAGRKDRTPLFIDRYSAMEGLKHAKLEIQNAIGISRTTKIILMLPGPNNISNENLSYYLTQLELYLDECIQYYNDWKNQNSEMNIDLVGWYFTKESLMKSNQLWHSFLNEAINLINNRNLKLFASPYNNSYSTSIQSAYLQEYWNYFDCIWLQPNCWFNPVGSLGNADNIDLDMLRLVGEYVFNNNLGINIERKGNLQDDWSQEKNLGYGRFLDYTAYGYHTGYVNLSKCYYDEGGEHWISAFSSNEIEREQYDELYKFIQIGNVGYIANGDFEQLNNANRFAYWGGSYSVINAEETDFNHRQFVLGCLQGDEAFSTDRISMNDGALLILKLDVREDGNDGITNSALIGIELFDSEGKEIKNGISDLLWSSFLDMWYKYVPTVEQWKTRQYELDLPTCVTSLKLYLRNWYCENPILWDNVQILADNTNFAPTSIWNTNFPIYVFDNGEPSFTSQLIPVNGSDIVDFKVMVRESMNDGRTNSALFRIDAYDENYNLITQSQGSFDGMDWSTEYNFWYKYIDIEVNLPSGSPWYESRWIEWHREFGLPVNSRWIRCYLHSWTLESNNVLTFYRPKLTINNPTSVQTNKTIKKMQLFPNYPNPFNSSTTIYYYLPKPLKVTIKIFNLQGQEVRSVSSYEQTSGEKSFVWEGLDQFGKRVSSGIYFYQIKADQYVKSRKMILLQ